MTTHTQALCPKHNRPLSKTGRCQACANAEWMRQKRGGNPRVTRTDAERREAKRLYMQTYMRRRRQDPVFRATEQATAADRTVFRAALTVAVAAPETTTRRFVELTAVEQRQVTDLFLQLTGTPEERLAQAGKRVLGYEVTW